MRSPTLAPAVVHLRGHGATPAHLEVSRYSPLAWAARVLRYSVGWVGATLATLVITFDPFVASFPFVIGLGYLYRTVLGRYHVRAFQGSCPRCAKPLTLEAGSKIPLPYHLVCYACHHEPELRLLRDG
jgi:hypothetical protein